MTLKYIINGKLNKTRTPNVVSIWLSFLIIFSFPVWGMDSECEKLTEYPLGSVQVMSSNNVLIALEKNKDSVRSNAPSKKTFKESFVANQARGKLGEENARHVMENLQFNPPLISIWTWFRQMGCEIKPYMHDRGGRGIDDIFVSIDYKNEVIDTRFEAIFHEAKYTSDCHFALGKTKVSCEQLSQTWLSNHFEGIKKRLNSGENQCDVLQYEVVFCVSCIGKLKTSISILEQQFRKGSFSRTASLMCPTGEITFYGVSNNSTSTNSNEFFDLFKKKLDNWQKKSTDDYSDTSSDSYSTDSLSTLGYSSSTNYDTSEAYLSLSSDLYPSSTVSTANNLINTNSSRNKEIKGELTTTMSEKPKRYKFKKIETPTETSAIFNPSQTTLSEFSGVYSKRDTKKSPSIFSPQSFYSSYNDSLASSTMSFSTISSESNNTTEELNALFRSMGTNDSYETTTPHYPKNNIHHSNF